MGQREFVLANQRWLGEGCEDDDASLPKGAYVSPTESKPRGGIDIQIHRPAPSARNFGRVIQLGARLPRRSRWSGGPGQKPPASKAGCVPCATTHLGPRNRDEFPGNGGRGGKAILSCRVERGWMEAKKGGVHTNSSWGRGERGEERGALLIHGLPACCSISRAWPRSPRPSGFRRMTSAPMSHTRASAWAGIDCHTLGERATVRMVWTHAGHT